MPQYNWLRSPPFYSLYTHPKDYGISKKDGNSWKELETHARTVGGTFLCDRPVKIVEVKDLVKLEKTIGLSIWPARWDFIISSVVVLDREATLGFPREGRLILHHELGHVLAGMRGEGKKWDMANAQQLAEEGCSPDMDFWTWSMQRAFDQIEWLDEAYKVLF